MLFIVASISCYCISFRLYNFLPVLFHSPISGIIAMMQMLHTPFFTVAPVLCEIARFVIKDFNARLKVYLTSSSTQHENVDKFQHLFEEYRKLSLLLEQLNEFVSLYLLLLQFIIIPSLILSLYTIITTTLIPELVHMFALCIVELFLIAAYNTWFPAALNEEVSMFAFKKQGIVIRKCV